MKRSLAILSQPTTTHTSREAALAVPLSTVPHSFYTVLRRERSVYYPYLDRHSRICIGIIVIAQARAKDAAASASAIDKHARCRWLSSLCSVKLYCFTALMLVSKPHWFVYV